MEGSGLPSGGPLVDGPTSAVATIILPGDEDPVAVMKRGAVSMTWQSSSGPEAQAVGFVEKPLKHVIDGSLALPVLYLHFLDKSFFLKDEALNRALRAGNDNSELVIALPPEYLDVSGFDGELGQHLRTVMTCLQREGEVVASACEGRSGGSRFTVKACSNQRCFRLYTSRPKADISLDKKSSGIPESADLYLFAENHFSVAHMSPEERQAFEFCIQELPSNTAGFAPLSIFLKVFYEGGFAYNKKEPVGGAYIPRCVGIAGMGITPAFEGQAGISTGYPYLVHPKFFRFMDTVPVTIGAISSMSGRHGRYGLSFTRCVYVWEGPEWESERKLNFCCPAPHGGFLYAPSDSGVFQQHGGLLYAFGEAKEAAGHELELAE